MSKTIKVKMSNARDNKEVRMAEFQVFDSHSAKVLVEGKNCVVDNHVESRESDTVLISIGEDFYVGGDFLMKKKANVFHYEDGESFVHYGNVNRDVCFDIMKKNNIKDAESRYVFFKDSTGFLRVMRKIKDLNVTDASLIVSRSEDVDSKEFVVFLCDMDYLSTARYYSHVFSREMKDCDLLEVEGLTNAGKELVTSSYSDSVREIYALSQQKLNELVEEKKKKLDDLLDVDNDEEKLIYEFEIEHNFLSDEMTLSVENIFEQRAVARGWKDIVESL